MSTQPPLVSIIVAVHSDAQWVEQTIRSCVEQSLARIEILCVVNRETADATRGLIPRDERIRIVEHEGGGSLVDAHRAGVLVAAAPYILLLRLGDELDPDAASKTHRKAGQSDADIVEFGIETIVGAPGGAGPLPPPKAEQGRLDDVEILRQRFPPVSPVEVRAWGLAFRTELLRTVYAALPSRTVALRAADLSIVLLASAVAKTYVSFEKRAYRHFPSRGTAGLSTEVSDQARRTLDTVDSLDAVASTVRDWARYRFNPEPLIEAYESTRLAVIGQAIRLSQHLPAVSREEFIGEVRARVEPTDFVVASTAFAPDAVDSVKAFADRLPLGRRRVRSVLLATNVLTTGGVSSVLLSQAQVLLWAGYRVTIAAHRRGSDESLIPEGVMLVEIVGSGRLERLPHWVALCREFEVDLVIDHRIMYSRDWPAYALVANAMNAPTIGWVHAFSGRPIYNGTDLLSLLQENVGALAQLMVLSPLDVAFWKLRGIEHVAYLPNPPSSIIVDSVGRVAPKSAPLSRQLELVWWGRLDETTKKVTQLIEVAVALKRAGADFRLRIVGPEWNDMTMTRLASLARKKGVERFVEVTGPRHGQSLIDTIDSSDIFINTSIIEGFLLTIPEAQSRGLPVVMYDLPWLLTVKDNPGVVSVPQGDSGALARAILELAQDSDQYEALSQASIDAAWRASTIDFSDLYQKLVLGDLPTEFSPYPTMESGQQILDLLIFLAENRLAPGSTSRPRGGGRRDTTASGGPRTLAASLERRLTAPGQRMINRAPWLHPTARRIKSALLRVAARQAPIRGGQPR